jgi:hypothetical protein
MTTKKLINKLILVTLLLPLWGYGQDISKNTFGKGISLEAQDESFTMKFSTRFQTLYIGELNTITEDYTDKMLIRRARLKFDGYVYNPKVKYKVELALSNRDTNSGRIPESGTTANIVLDAVIKWDFAPDWSLWFGQTKLPGNRERVISSQKLQFVDRSQVNSQYNIDRDKGIQLRHSNTFGEFVIRQAVAFSLGEGRNIISDNPGDGHEYTGRLEFLPMGNFTGKGDYFGSDLKRESTPKLSIGITGDYNQNATRQRGNLGSFNVDSTGEYLTNDLQTVFVDMMFKYKGFSAASEWAKKSTSQTNNGYGTGTGIVFQAGYLLKSNWEIAGRYTDIVASGANSTIRDVTEYTLGLSRYVVGHQLKIQSDVTYADYPSNDNEIIFRLQTELAF